VVHAHDLWANLTAVPAAKIAGTPLVLSSQRDLAHLNWYTPARRKVIARIHRWSNGVIVNSSAVSDLVKREFRVPANRVRIIRNGVDFERFARSRPNRKQYFPDLSPQTRLIVTIANMHNAAKGHRELLDAIARVRSRNPNAKFVLVGDGEERFKIEEAAEDLGVRDTVLFLGQRADIPELLACCDVFVLPSRAEGLPNSLLEAMAAGLPVIATAVGGVPEVIENGVSGLLVPPGDSASLADAVLRVLHDANFADQLARAGRECARVRFAFDRAITELVSFYDLRNTCEQ
jgi:L-malate glycosyltransferase